MNTRNIQPIVEGRGEVDAFPVLLRRLRNEARAFLLDVNRPIRRNRTELVRKQSLRKAVTLALLQDRCSAILILFDADDDCPKTMAADLLDVARSEAGETPCAVVMAVREYEAWFLGGIESLRGTRGILDNAVGPSKPEALRGAKEELESRMEEGRHYHEIADQPALSALVDLAAVYSSCRSFRRLVKAFGELAGALNALHGPWPPRHWEAHGGP